MTTRRKSDAVRQRIDELLEVIERLEADEGCPPASDHVRVSARQRCACGACTARAAVQRALVALRSLEQGHREDDVRETAPAPRRWSLLGAR